MTRTTGDTAPRTRLTWNRMKDGFARRMSQADDRGMTLVELIVTVALTSLVISMTTFIMVNVLNATTGEDATISGVQQATLAERTFTQYMRSTAQLLSVDPNDLTFQTYAGMGASATNAPTTELSGVPQIETLEIQLCTTKSPYVDSLEILYGLPSTGTGSTGLHECISSSSPTSTTTAVPGGVRLVEAFDISPPGVSVADIFSYYTLTGSSFTRVPTSTFTAACTVPPSTSALCTKALATVSAIGINITFLPPPGGVTKGFHTELGTTVQAEVFLRNSTS
jgi:prepilin-type N-terminal cleavage/methylation domain-containing protein